MKNQSSVVDIRSLIRAQDVKPTIILIVSALLLTVDRYFGSIEFARRTFASVSSFDAALFMFASAFVLMILVPLAVVVFGFREPLKSYGFTLGDWKGGLFLVLVVFPIVALALLYPASHTGEMRAFYPFDKGAGDSLVSFLRLQLTRTALFYTAWEFFFRGFMLFGLRKYVGDWLAICIQTIPSCLWHIGMPTGEIFSSIAGGILFGVLAIRTNSIFWPFLLHCLIGIGLDFFIVMS
jgi:membrane protease YdiL (CAAX protease family)